MKINTNTPPPPNRQLSLYFFYSQTPGFDKTSIVWGDIASAVPWLYGCFFFACLLSFCLWQIFMMSKKSFNAMPCTEYQIRLATIDAAWYCHIGWQAGASVWALKPGYDQNHLSKIVDSTVSRVLNWEMPSSHLVVSLHTIVQCQQFKSSHLRNDSLSVQYYRQYRQGL